MNIRTAVACTLAVFLLSFALIVGVGLAQPVHAVAVNAAPPVQQSDVSQLKRDFLQAPTAGQQSESLPPTAAAPEPQNATQNIQPAPQQQPPQPVPVVAQPPPPPPPDYYYTTRAS